MTQVNRMLGVRGHQVIYLFYFCCVNITKFALQNVILHVIVFKNSPRVVFRTGQKPTGPNKQKVKKDQRRNIFYSPFNSSVQTKGLEPGYARALFDRRATTAPPPAALFRRQSPIKLRMCRDYGRRPASRIKPDNPRRRSKAASYVTLLQTSRHNITQY